MPLTRRSLVQRGSMLLAAGPLLAAAQPLFAQSPPPAPSPSKIPDKGPKLDAELVRQFVGAAHGNLEKTRELFASQAALINATWDWGGGDWETGLGGAAHMGNQEIARFLLSQGARMDVFAAAMLGKIEIVKAFLADDPSVANLKGPHGIPLVRHAIAGKQQMVVDLLVAAGAQV